MSKNKVVEWESSVDGKNYKFAYQKVKGGHELDANGVKQTIKAGPRSVLLGFDEGFDLDGRPARLVLENKEPDVAVDGVYLRSGKEYVQAPMWVLVFAIACLVLVFIGGVIGGVIGILGSMACVAVAKRPMATPVRMLICLGISIAAWVIASLIAGVVTNLLF